MHHGDNRGTTALSAARASQRGSRPSRHSPFANSRHKKDATQNAKPDLHSSTERSRSKEAVGDHLAEHLMVASYGVFNYE